MDLQIENASDAYWNQRAAGYSQVNWEELDGIQRTKWSKLLDDEIQRNFPNRSRENISVLDIGAGPGFISIVLSELGYSVTAADYSREMLKHAEKNSAECGVSICLTRENAEELSFEDCCFDVVVSRNLTWNLPHPEQAYEEWCRVLKSNGLMLVFDANWYNYLTDDDSRKAYDADRKKVALSGLDDYNIGENFDKMEAIAQKLPMTGKLRPEWDKNLLTRYDFSCIEGIENIGEYVYSEKEKINYGSTPLFMIRAVKRGTAGGNKR